MKVTAQEEYGLRCMMQAATSEPDRPVSAAHIASHEGLSVPYVGKLLNLLREAGLVESLRGRSGGYYIAVPGQLIIPVTRDGIHLELLIDEVTLNPLRPRRATAPTHWIADFVKPRANLTLNVKSTIAPGDQSACLAIAWRSAPENRDRPRASIPDPAELYYAELPAAACGALSD